MLFILSCGGSKRTFETQSPTQDLSTYVVLEIPDFKSSVPHVPEQSLWQIPNDLAKKLEYNKTFVGVSRGAVDITDGVLILDGIITDIQPPEWYKQIVKDVTITTNVRLIDKAESLVIAEVYFEGTAKWGLLGGTSVFADIRLVDEIINYLEQKFPRSNQPSQQY